LNAALDGCLLFGSVFQQRRGFSFALGDNFLAGLDGFFTRGQARFKVALTRIKRCGAPVRSGFDLIERFTPMQLLLRDHRLGGGLGLLMRRSEPSLACVYAAPRLIPRIRAAFSTDTVKQTESPLGDLRAEFRRE
jgi:hypothetical protein